MSEETTNDSFSSSETTDECVMTDECDGAESAADDDAGAEEEEATCDATGGARDKGGEIISSEVFTLIISRVTAR